MTNDCRLRSGEPMRIRGFHRLRSIVERRRGDRFVASLERADYLLPDELRVEIRRKLASILDRNILPFWFPDCLDSEAGGYHSECNIEGDWQPSPKKNLVSQARILWFVSRLMNFGRRSAENVLWAQHGFEFLKDHLLDEEYGGFYWEVDCERGEPTMPDKHLYGQAFALYALSEFALATGDANARSMAHHLFELVDDRAHDASHGGYHEFFRRDWQVPDPNELSYMGYLPAMKQLNTHLHLMEALTRYASLADGELIRTRLAELIHIQSDTVVSKQDWACTDVFSTEWQRHTGGKFSRVTYGHDLSNVWMLIEANCAAGLSNAPLVEAYSQLFLSAVRYGWDRMNSGFFFRGKLSQPADERNKIWWTQAEAMLAALHLYKLTGHTMYFQMFAKTLNWIDRHQIDWPGGEWYAAVDEAGTPFGNKATNANGRWKTPYHNGRAVIRCIELLGLGSEASYLSTGGDYAE